MYFITFIDECQLKAVRKEISVPFQDQSENKNKVDMVQFFSIKVVWCIDINIIIKRNIKNSKHLTAFLLTLGMRKIHTAIGYWEINYQH